jgi:elongation factor G
MTNKSIHHSENNSTNNASSVRNMGIMAHIDAGKTTLTERILYYAGKTHQIGEVHDGQATMDFMVQEQERGITISSAATTIEWNAHTINLIDTPGHVDFTIEVERSLRVLDGGIIVLDSSQGVEPQTETVWRQATKHGVPRFFFLNKMDKVGSQVDRCLQDIKSKLNAKPILVQFPLFINFRFSGLIDLLHDAVYFYPTDDKDSLPIITPIQSYNELPPMAEIDAATWELIYKAKQNFIESICDYNDNLAELYLLGEPISQDLLVQTMRHITITQKAFLVFVGSAFKNKGVQLLLDAVTEFLPAPTDRIIESVDLASDDATKLPIHHDDAFLSALVFKISHDPFMGPLFFTRIYSGSVTAGQTVWNPNTKQKERVQKIWRIHANKKQEIPVCLAGDLVAITGLKHIKTGFTLCDTATPVLLEKIYAPTPVVSLALEPKSQEDVPKILSALDKLLQEDPSLVLVPNQSDIIIQGMGELHLQIILDRMFREFNVKVTAGKPQVSYKESITKPIRIPFQQSRIFQNKTTEIQGEILLKPQETLDNTYALQIPCPDPNIEKIFIESAKDSLQNGPLCGFGLVKISWELVSCTMPASLSELDPVLLRMAFGQSIQKALQQSSCTMILEPIMSVDVFVPEDYVGGILSDINSRKGQIQNQESKDQGQVIQAHIPLSKLFGYETDIRSLSQGRASSSHTFIDYQPIPKETHQKLMGEI